MIGIDEIKSIKNHDFNYSTAISLLLLIKWPYLFLNDVMKFSIISKINTNSIKIILVVEAIGKIFSLIGARILGSTLREFYQAFVHVRNRLFQIDVVVSPSQRWLMNLGECP